MAKRKRRDVAIEFSILNVYARNGRTASLSAVRVQAILLLTRILKAVFLFQLVQQDL